MANLIIRDLPDNLVLGLRDLAVRNGQTVKGCVSALIRDAIRQPCHPAEIVQDAPAAIPQPAPPKPRPQDEVPLPKAVQPFLQQAATLARPAHNKSTCRLYGCPLCEAGVRDLADHPHPSKGKT